MQLARKFDGKKFMWDGAEYTEEPQAREALEKYKAAGFETHMQKEGDRFYLFTRKVVTEVILEGAPPN